MRDYFIRRLLLIPPTLFGITLIVFAITRVVPGGPVEQRLMEIQMANMAGGSSTNTASQQALSEAPQDLRNRIVFRPAPLSCTLPLYGETDSN